MYLFEFNSVSSLFLDIKKLDGDFFHVIYSPISLFYGLDIRTFTKKMQLLCMSPIDELKSCSNCDMIILGMECSCVHQMAKHIAQLKNEFKSQVIVGA